MKAEICKARAGQGEQGHRLGTGLRQPCCVKQSSARNLEAEWLLVRTGIQMARREGFSGSNCDSAFAGDGAAFALGTSSTCRAFQTAHSRWHSALVWYLPGCDTAAHVPARPPAPSHPRNEQSSELREGLSRGLLSQPGRGLVRNRPRKQSKAGQSKLH